MFAVYVQLFEHRKALAGHDVNFFVDNVGVLAQLTKGSSGAADLGPLVGAIHFLLVWFDIRVWWEYVESEANISDGLSRDGASDSLSRRLGWKPTPAILPPWGKGWRLCAADCMRVFR